MRSFTFAILVVYITNIEGAKKCFVGSNNKFESKVCAGDQPENFFCQKFECTGGMSDDVGNIANSSILVFRSCVPEAEKCNAQARYCHQLGGSGECFTCSGDDCNSAQLNFPLTALTLAFTIFLTRFA